jgi:hypothetical protein
MIGADGIKGNDGYWDRFLSSICYVKVVEECLVNLDQKVIVVTLVNLV